MADSATEPGAPSKTPSGHGGASDGGVAKKAQEKAPTLVGLLRTPDKIILRLNKLLASPGGLSSFLSTFNYTLYLLAYLDAKSVPLKLKLLELLGRATPANTAEVATAPFSIAELGGLLSRTRTTLRLFGLFPMYAWMRQLLHGPKPGQDMVLYTTAVTQCTLYMAFQFLENVALLTDHKVITPSVTARWNKSGSTARIYLWSYRAWMGGVLCDFVRLFREAQLTSTKRAQRASGEKDVASREADEKEDAKWWSEMVTPVAWLPVAVQFSSETGIPGFNLGIMGACGALAGLSRTASLWATTQDA